MVTGKMSSEQIDAVVAGFERLYSSWTKETGIGAMRTQWDAFLSEPLLPASTEDLIAGGVPCRWVKAPEVGGEERAIIFLHGGGYQIGSLRSHHNIMVQLSASSACPVLGVNYRLAPEHRCPAPLEDALAAYRWVLEQGFAPGRIALCGDSAGGALVVSLMVLARDLSIPLPAAAVAMSPWVDMEAGGASYETNAQLDPVTNRATILAMARTYLGKGGNPRDPRASPIHADLSDLPPLLVQVGEREVLLDDARFLVERAAAAGVDTSLRIWPHMIHVFQLFAGRLDEADAAVAEAGTFLHKHLTQ